MYNTILKRFVYILIFLADSLLSSVSIGLIGEFYIGVKIVYSISIEKPVWVWKGIDLQDINNIIVWFFTHFISFECMYSRNILSPECCQLLQNRNNTHKKGLQLGSVISAVVNNIWIKSLIDQYSISNQLILLKFIGMI